MKHLPENERRELLNRETGIVTWPDIQRHFARGVLILVNKRLDLVSVADTFILDHKSQLEQWRQADLVQILPDDIAAIWSRKKIILWAIVIAPWVLVQEQTHQPK